MTVVWVAALVVAGWPALLALLPESERAPKRGRKDVPRILGERERQRGEPRRGLREVFRRRAAARS